MPPRSPSKRIRKKRTDEQVPIARTPTHDPDLLPYPGQVPPEFAEWLKTKRIATNGPFAELVPAQVDALVAGVAAHGSLRVAAGIVGRDVGAIRRWLDRGHSDMERRVLARSLGQDPGPESEYERLLCEVVMAVSWWGGKLLAVVQRAAEGGDVQAAQWLLARVGPKIAAPRVEVDELGGMGGRAGEGESPEDRRARMLAKLDEIVQRKAALVTGMMEEDERDG